MTRTATRSHRPSVEYELRTLALWHPQRLPWRALWLYTLMHIHRCMGSKTISLEASAYERLKAAKRSGESFSEAVHRILGGKAPSLLDFRGFMGRKAADRLADAIARMRQEDVKAQRRRMPGRR